MSRNKKSAHAGKNSVAKNVTPESVTEQVQETAAAEKDAFVTAKTSAENISAEDLQSVETKTAEKIDPAQEAASSDKAVNPDDENPVKQPLSFIKSISKKTSGLPGRAHKAANEKGESEKPIKSAKKAVFDYDGDNEIETKAFGKNIKERILSANPVFIKAVAIVPILGAAYSLKNGVMLACAMLLTVVLLNIVMYPLWRVIPRRYRFAAAFAVAGAAVTPGYALSQFLAPSIAAQCGIYLPILAICALPMMERGFKGKKNGFVKTVAAAFADGIGFALAAILFSAVREVIGQGTLYDRTLPYLAKMKFPFALTAAGAFIILGLLLALFRKISGYRENGSEGQR